MTNLFNYFKKLIPVAIVGMALFACDTPDSASLFDENYQPQTPPVITAVSPADWYFAGYQEITITGENFITNTNQMFVYFNNRRATILSAAPNQIVVRTPNYVADSIGIKVSIIGVEAFSNSWRYRLEALFSDVIAYPANINPWAITRGTDGTFYVSYQASGSPAGIRTHDSEGTLIAENYSPPQSWFYRSAALGPDGSLYLVRGGAINILYRVPPGGGVPANFVSGSAAATGIGRTEDVMVDPNGFIWTGGTNEGNANNSRINRIGPGTTVTRFPFDAQIYALAHHNGYIYVAGTRGSDSFIWRMELSADNEPGPEEVVVNLTDAGATEVITGTNFSRPTAIAVSADGTVFVGMNGNRPIFEVSNSGQVSEMYPGILPGNILKMEFIPDTQFLLMTLLPTSSDLNNRVIRVNVQKDAP